MSYSTPGDRADAYRHASTHAPIPHSWGPNRALDVNWPGCPRVWTSAVRGRDGHFTGACRAGGPTGARGEPMARQSLPDAEVPDPGRINSQKDFCRELTLARQQAGLTTRDVAKASGIPVSTVGDYFAARHLPPARQPEP